MHGAQEEEIIPVSHTIDLTTMTVEANYKGPRLPGAPPPPHFMQHTLYIDLYTHLLSTLCSILATLLCTELPQGVGRRGPGSTDAWTDKGLVKKALGPLGAQTGPGHTSPGPGRTRISPVQDETRPVHELKCYATWALPVPAPGVAHLEKRP